MTDFDEAVVFLGDWGLFQKLIFCFFCASMIPNGFSLGIVFVADTPKHQCCLPQLNLSQEWYPALIPVTVVDGEEKLSRCSRFSLDLVKNLSAQGLAPADVNLTELKQEECVDGWSYSKDIYQSTIVSDFDLVCKDQWKQPFTMTVYFMGVFIGCFVFGQLSDRYGRKPVFFATMAWQGLFMFLQVFSVSWTMFAVLMFFNGFGNMANLVAAYVAGAEILTGNVRVLFLTLGMGLSFTVGYLLMPFLAYFIREWRDFQIAISLPCLLFLPFWWYIPESPRWLLSKGRVKEAELIVREAARLNKVSAPRVIFEENTTDTKTEEKNHTALDLFKTGNIRTATVILCFLWFSMSVGYFGVSLNTSSLTADPYLGSFISAVVEIPAYVCSLLSLKFVPRRICTVTSTVLGGVALLLLPAVPHSLQWLTVTLAMVGKFCIVACTNLLFAYTAEVFPTVVRNTATGVCSTSARIGSCIAPFIIQLSRYFTFLPPVVLGTLSVGSAVLALFLPETFRRPFSETIEDMQQCKRIQCPGKSKEQQQEDETIPEEVLLESRF